MNTRFCVTFYGGPEDGQQLHFAEMPKFDYYVPHPVFDRHKNADGESEPTKTSMQMIYHYHLAKDARGVGLFRYEYRGERVEGGDPHGTA